MVGMEEEIKGDRGDKPSGAMNHIGVGEPSPAEYVIELKIQVGIPDNAGWN